MSTRDLAAFLLVMMPVSFAVMTLVFVALWLVLIRQDSGTPLGTWINWLFLATAWVSLIVTSLVYYFYVEAESDDLDSVVTWSLVIGTVTAPWAVSFCGVKVAVWNRRLDRQIRRLTPDQDAREAIQNDREASQNDREADQNRRDDRQDRRDRP